MPVNFLSSSENVVAETAPLTDESILNTDQTGSSAERLLCYIWSLFQHTSAIVARGPAVFQHTSAIVARGPAGNAPANQWDSQRSQQRHQPTESDAPCWRHADTQPNTSGLPAERYSRDRTEHSSVFVQ